MRINDFIKILLPLTFICLPVLSQAADAPAEEDIPVMVKENQDWLMGKVLSVDAANRNILIDYYDYESETQKQGRFYVTDKSVFEDGATIDDLKPDDQVSLDYTVKDGLTEVLKIVHMSPADAQLPSYRRNRQEEPSSLAR